MFDLNLLAITVSDYDAETIEPVIENENGIIWAIVLTVVIALCIFAGKYLPSASEYFKNKRKERELARAEKARNEELERLHRIKEKNKRK